MTHDLDAEQAVIGALMFSPAMCEHVAGLEAAHFYDPVHQRIYAEIVRRQRAGLLADAVALKTWAAADPGINELGGAIYLLTLLERAAPLSGQVAGYAAMIRDAATKRALEATLKAALGSLAATDALEAVAGLETALRDMGDHGEDVGADLATAGAALIDDLDKPALSTGFPSLDARLGGLHRGELTILAGRPSMGKTTFAAQIGRNVAERGRAVHFASLEMPKEQLACRAISAASFRRQYGTEQVEYYHIRNGSNTNRELLRTLAADLPRTLIVDDRPAQTLAQLEQGARATRRRLKRLDLIVVDYLQLMRASRSDGRVNEVTEISQGLKAIAKRLDCPLVALSQLSRGVEGRDNKRPTLSDLRDSGAIEQDADVVIGCYREAYYLERAEPDGLTSAGDWAAWKTALERCRHEFEAITLKQRGGPIGTDRLEAHLAFDTIRDRRVA